MIKRKQGGFGLIDVVLALSLSAIFLLTVIPMGLNHYRQKQVDEFVTHIKDLVTQMQLYQYHKTTKEGVTSNAFLPGYADGWPASFDALMTDYGSAFWDLCGPMNESKGTCIRPDTLPFTPTKLSFEEGVPLPLQPNTVYLVIPTGTLPDDGTLSRWATPLLALPGATLRPDLNVRINLRPLTKSLMYDEFLRKDGSVHLTQDWDVGGEHSITNVRDVTIRNSDGTQKLVSLGLSNSYTLKHGDILKKQTCPSGTSPKIMLGIGSVHIDKAFELTGSQRAYLIENAFTYWKVGLEIRVKRLSNNAYDKINSGEILAITQCQ